MPTSLCWICCCCFSEAQSYENLTELPDYVKVEDDVILPPPPYQHLEPTADCCPDNASTEDYDDIGAEEDNQGDEDYDDVE